MKKQIQKLAVLIGMVSIAAIGCKKDDSTSVTSTSTVKTSMASAVTTVSSTNSSISNTLGEMGNIAPTTDTDGNSIFTLTGANTGVIKLSADGLTTTFVDAKIGNITLSGTIVSSADGAQQTTNLKSTNSTNGETVEIKNYLTTTDSDKTETSIGTIVATIGTTVYTIADANVVVKKDATYASGGIETLVITGGSTYKFEFLANDLCNLTVNSEATQSNVKQSDLGF